MVETSSPKLTEQGTTRGGLQQLAPMLSPSSRTEGPDGSGPDKTGHNGNAEMETLEIHATKNHLLRKAPYIQELTIPVLI